MPFCSRGVHNATMVATMHCPICGSAFIDEPVDCWSRYVLRQCSSCDLQLWDPPEAGDAAWYDASDHYVAMAIVDWLGWYHRWGLEHLPRSVTSLIDIGCADGRFVHAAVARGIDAIGVDHSARLVDLGNQRYGGDRLSRLSLDDLMTRGRRFDAVTLFEVIEHVPDPLVVLDASAQLLNSRGFIVVSTPNRMGQPRAPESLDRPPHHLTRWTPRTLEILLDRAGLDLVELGLSPGRVGLTSALLGIRFGIIVGILRRRTQANGDDRPRDARAIRQAILVKERLAVGLATLLDPFIGGRFSAGSMVMVARRRR